MSNADRLEGLPKKLRARHTQAFAIEEPIERFRAFNDLMGRMKQEARSFDRKFKESKKLMQVAETDITFVERHRAKVELVLRALRLTYGSPGRAFATINKLCRDYPVDYVKDVILLGSYRLAKPKGMAIMSFRSAERLEADANYETAVMPALMLIISDHKTYLKLADEDLDTKYQEYKDTVSLAQRIKLGIDGAVSEYEREMKSAAVAIPADEVENLGPDEASVRLGMLSERQREAELTAREAGD